MMRAHTLLTAVRLEATPSSSSRNNGAPPPHSQNPPARRPLLSVTKPSWIVRTESNVYREKRRKPDPPCVVCRGSGRVDCTHCRGKGRTNDVHLAMLPKREWPKWCRTCGGSGLGYCPRCLGTGEYRYLMGFHFMNREASDTENRKNHQVRGNLGRRGVADLFHNDDPSEQKL